MNCVECNELSKYKCPVCRGPYCSVKCYKEHKTKPCEALNIQSNTEIKPGDKEYKFPTEDTVPFERLKMLGESKDLKKCLENPHLRKILQELDQSPHPDSLMQHYMKEPIFTEFVDECLKIVDPPDKK